MAASIARKPKGARGEETQDTTRFIEEVTVFSGLGARLLTLRNEAGLSQAELSSRTGIPSVHVYDLESGQSVPTLQELICVCCDLGASLDALLLGRGVRYFSGLLDISWLPKQKREAIHRITGWLKPEDFYQLTQEQLALYQRISMAWGPGMPNLGQRIRLARERMNMSLQKLAECLRMSVDEAEKMENSNQVPSLSCIFRIAELLGTSLNSLLLAGQTNQKDWLDLSFLPIYKAHAVRSLLQTNWERVKEIPAPSKKEREEICYRYMASCALNHTRQELLKRHPFDICC